MELRLHANATTTPRLRRYIQQSDKSDRALAEELGISVATVRRWRQRDEVNDREHTPHRLHTALSEQQARLLCWLREQLLLPLDELLQLSDAWLGVALSRASLDRYLRRHASAHVTTLQAHRHVGSKALKLGIAPGNLQLHYQRCALLPEDGGEWHLLWAQEQVSGWLYAEAFAGASPQLVPHWLERAIETLPIDIQSIETDGKPLLSDPQRSTPLQQWCIERLMVCTPPQEAGHDVALRLDCPLSELLPRFAGLRLPDILAQMLPWYNQQLQQKKLYRLSPVSFLQQHATQSAETD